MMFPNFVVIGSSRSGTTSLHHHLKEHPQVYVTSVLEPRFFAFEGDDLDYHGPGDHLLKGRVVTTVADYVALFDDVVAETAVGEVSPAYLSSASAPHRIRHYVPNAKIIAILRNPVERAISSFRLEQLDGLETAPSLAVALDLEAERVRANWSYVWRYGYRGRYYTHLCRYFDLFPRERIKVLRYEDWDNDGGVILLQEIFAFLGVDDRVLPERAVRLNSTRADRFATRGIPRFDPSPELKARLARFYRDEINRLEELVDLDLSTWRREQYSVAAPCGLMEISDEPEYSRQGR
ncbi:MAG: sulfotransferase family protein [Pseudonocardiaceae bacterium]